MDFTPSAASRPIRAWPYVIIRSFVKKSIIENKQQTNDDERDVVTMMAACSEIMSSSTDGPFAPTVNACCQSVNQSITHGTEAHARIGKNRPDTDRRRQIEKRTMNNLVANTLLRIELNDALPASVARRPSAFSALLSDTVSRTKSLNWKKRRFGKRNSNLGNKIIELR